MRLICTLNDPNLGQVLSNYLTKQGIANQLEIVSNTDWGSPDYGSVTCRIWITDEDQLENALSITAEFQQNPLDTKFVDEKTKDLLSGVLDSAKAKTARAAAGPAPIVAPMGPITSYIFYACILLLIFSTFTTPTVTAPFPANFTPALLSPIDEQLMYDYPQAYEYLNEVVALYGIDSLKNPDKLPEKGQQLLEKFNNTPYWHGIYEQLVQHFKKPGTPWNFDAPLFEKIRQGEIWRLFTPMLLHSGFLHLFFNMIWLIVLGKQMEQRLGTGRYLLFIAIVAFISNTAQYLMSGPNFVGFSGVLVGMLTFIWVRQMRTAWEGYNLEKGTMGFITLFILFMFGIQIVAFFFESHDIYFFSTGIANTAHLVGGLTGYLLGHLDYFSWQNRLGRR